MNSRHVPLLAVFNAVLFAIGCHGARPEPEGAPTTLKPKARIETTLGDIVIELDGEKAPGTVLNFLQYVEDKFYNGTIFHRVIDTFTIQGGGYTPDMEKKTDGLRPAIVNESTYGLLNERGTIAIARRGGKPHSAQAEFFINVADNPGLDRRRDGAAYCVFGRVVEGMDTVERIRTTPVGSHPKWDHGRRPHVPVTPVVIKSVRLLDRFDHTRAKQLAKTTEFEALNPDEARKIRIEEAKEAEKRALQALIKAIEKETGRKVVTTASGLRYVDHRIGSGLTPTMNNSVVVQYVGTLADGTVFDSTFDRGEPATLELVNVVAGWQEGLKSMATGGKRTLIVPPDLAFGTRGHPSGVPGNVTVIYELELLAIE